MKISVLCPTRKRWQMLRESLTSLDSLADAPSQVEYLLAVDPDDHPEPMPVTVRMWTAPARFGYTQLQEYYNSLAEQAHGEWLFLWNDDTVMHTHGWDTVVVNEKPGLLFPRHNGPMHCNAFPIWPAEWTRVLGHVSLGMFCDSWMQVVGERLGMDRAVAIYLTHDTPQDETFIEGRGMNPSNGDILKTYLDQDVEKLAAHLGISL